jgi:DnaJ like chaperone protein
MKRSWTGAIAGAVLGLLLGRFQPQNALIGALLGYFVVDRYLNARSAYTGPKASGTEVQTVFFETTFLVMGHLAKVDGRVSEEEIQAARSVMHAMRLRPEDVRRAIELFTAGKRADTYIFEKVTRLRQVCGREPELIHTFLEVQIELALSKGDISAAERDVLWHVADRLGVGRVELSQLEAVLRARRSFGQRQSTPPLQTSLDQAFKALGIDSAASDADVKKAYRRLMNQHHPDKMLARGLPDSMLEVAKQRTRETRSAYELIKAHRGIK